jgi:hypothetical protein
LTRIYAGFDSTPSLARRQGDGILPHLGSFLNAQRSLLSPKRVGKGGEAQASPPLPARPSAARHKGRPLQVSRRDALISDRERTRGA